MSCVQVFQAPVDALQPNLDGHAAYPVFAAGETVHQPGAAAEAPADAAAGEGESGPGQRGLLLDPCGRRGGWAWAGPAAAWPHLNLL